MKVNCHLKIKTLICRWGMEEKFPPKNKNICNKNENIECRHGMKEKFPPKIDTFAIRIEKK